MDRRLHRRRRRRGRRRRLWVGGLLAGCGLAVAWQVDGVRAVTVGLPPRLHDSGPAPPPPPGVERALGVAHNAGNRLDAARRAVEAGAEIVEVDVVRVAGRLRAGHDPPVPVLAEAVFRGPDLAEVWRVARPHARVKLDLKQTGEADTAAVVDAVDRWTRADGGSPHGPVVVTSREPDVVRAVAAAPVTRRGHAAAFVTLADTDAVERFRDDPGLQRAVSGVSVHQDLLDAGTLGWFDDLGLDVLAWTVDDHARAHDLVAAGVDGVTTDDLALVRALAGG